MKRVLLTMIALSSFMTIASGGGGGAKPLELKSREELIGGWKRLTKKQFENLISEAEGRSRFSQKPYFDALFEIEEYVLRDYLTLEYFKLAQYLLSKAEHAKGPCIDPHDLRGSIACLNPDQKKVVLARILKYNYIQESDSFEDKYDAMRKPTKRAGYIFHEGSYQFTSDLKEALQYTSELEEALRQQTAKKKRRKKLQQSLG